MLVAELCRALFVCSVAMTLGGAVPCAAAGHDPCPASAPCPVPGGVGYSASPPPNWNGSDDLRIAVWLHGFRQSPRDIANDAALAATIHGNGYLLVLPEAIQLSWSMGATAERNDVDFLTAVLADVRARYPTRGETVLLGFSLGAMMVWTTACERPGLFDRYVAFSGTWWRPYPEQCSNGATRLVHVHGATDLTVPLEGRRLASGRHQGDIDQTTSILAARKQCERPQPVQHAPDGLQCQAWSRCTTGGAIALCIHQGGHWVEPEWVGWVLDHPVGR